MRISGEVYDLGLQPGSTFNAHAAELEQLQRPGTDLNIIRNANASEQLFAVAYVPPVINPRTRALLLRNNIPRQSIVIAGEPSLPCTRRK